MLVGNKVRVYTTSEQEVYLEQAFGACRYAYNHLLDCFSQDGVRWSKKDGQEKLKEIKQDREWFGLFSASGIRSSSVDNLDRAYKNFFKNHKKKRCYPRFKKRGQKDRYSIRDKKKINVTGRSLKIEKCPHVFKLQQEIRFEGTVKQVTFSKKAGKYYASFLVETNHQYQSAGNGTVGVDLGIKSFATTSDNETFQPNQPLKRNLSRLTKKQRNLSRKKRGSNRRAKAKFSIQKLHHRIQRQRSDYIHKTTDYLTKRYATIVVEDLNVSGVVKNRRLSRAIQDSGFGEFRRQLEYKSRFKGNKLVFADRFFPSSKTCSSCGYKKDKLDLSERVFACESCGFTADRDLNAALNLKNYGGQEARGHLKRTEESCKTTRGVDTDAVNYSFHGV